MDNFFINHFNDLPVDIKIKIFLMIPSFKPPKPLFDKEMVVQLTYKEKEKIWHKKDDLICKYSIPFSLIGDYPTDKLKIIENPEWDKDVKEWKYKVGYGPFLRSNMTFLENQMVIKN